MKYGTLIHTIKVLLFNDYHLGTLYSTYIA